MFYKESLLSYFAGLSLFVLATSVSPQRQVRAAELPYGGNDLRLWLDASDTASLNLDTVTFPDRVIGWNDRTGFGGNNIANNGTGPSGQRPLWEPNQINGRPAVLFDTTARRIIGSSFLSGNSARTIFIVGRSNSSSNANIFDPNGQGTGATLFRITPELGVRFGNGNELFGNPLGGSYAIVGAQLPGGGTIGDTEMFNNSATFLPTASVSSPGNAVNTGTNGYQLGQAGFTGNIAEILAFESALTTSEIDDIGFYLQQKYAIGSSFVAPTNVFFDDLGTGSDWGTSANWNTAAEPTAAQNAFIGGGGLTAELSQTGEVAGTLTIGHNQATLPGNGTLNVNTGGALNVGGAFHLGGDNGTTGTLNLNDGAVTGTGGLAIAEAPGSTGFLNIGVGGGNPTLTITGGNFETALNGAGTVVMEGGTLNVNSNNLIVGQNASSLATFTINDGTIDVANQLRIANRGSGHTFTQNGGNVMVGGVLDMGNNNGVNASGLYVKNDGTLTTGGLILGLSGDGQGTFTQAGGMTDINGNTLLADGNASSVGTLNVSGGTFETNQFEIGRDGTGLVTHVGGTVNVVAGNLVISQNSNGDGTYNISNGNVNVTNNLNMNAGTSLLQISGGVVDVSGNLNQASGSGNSEINISGGQLIVDGSILDRSGTSTINLEGGTLASTTTNITVDNFNINPTNPGGNVTYTRDGGTLRVLNDLRLGGESNAGSNHRGNLTQNGGTVRVDGNLLFGNGGGTEGGVYRLNGGTLRVDGDILETANNVDAAQLQIQGGNLVVTNGNTIRVQRFGLGDDAGTGAGIFTKTGGTLESTGTTIVGNNFLGELTLNNVDGSAANMIVSNTAGSAGSFFTLNNGTDYIVTQTGDNRFDVGNQNGSNGTVNILGGSSLQVNGRIDLGQTGNASGTINILDGTLNAQAGLFIAGDGTGDNSTQGSVVVGPNGVVNVGGTNTEVGRGGIGTFELNGGQFNQNAGNFVIAQGGNSNGTATINSGLLEINNQLNMNSGTSALNVSGGTVNVGDNVQLANGSGTSTITVSAGELNVSDTIVSRSGTGIITQTGGFVNLTQPGGSAGSNGNLTIDGNLTYSLLGGVLDFHDHTGSDQAVNGISNSLNITDESNFIFNGGTLQDVSTINPTDVSNTFFQEDGRFVVGRDGGLDPNTATQAVTTIAGSFDQQGGTLALDVFGPNGGGYPGGPQNPSDPDYQSDIDMLSVMNDVFLDGELAIDFNGTDPTPWVWFDAVKAETGEFMLGDDFFASGNLGAGDSVLYRVIDNPFGAGQILQIATPEPASLVAWVLLGIAGGVYQWRRRHQR
jgi:fibronectin-binding autotransporter adhesin